MSTSRSTFYLKKQKISLDFSAQNTSSDGGFLLLHKLMLITKIINLRKQLRDKLMHVAFFLNLHFLRLIFAFCPLPFAFIQPEQ